MICPMRNQTKENKENYNQKEKGITERAINFVIDTVDYGCRVWSINPILRTKPKIERKILTSQVFGKWWRWIDENCELLKISHTTVVSRNLKISSTQLFL